MSLGQEIRALRLQKGVRQTALADELAHVKGLTQARLAQIENYGARVSAGQLEHIIRALSLSELEAARLRELAASEEERPDENPEEEAAA